MANRTTILEEAFNLEVPIRLHPTKPPKLGLDATKYYRYHHGIGHNTEDYWALKDKIEELIQARYLAQFFKRPDNHQMLLLTLFLKSILSSLRFGIWNLVFGLMNVNKRGL